MLVAQAAQRDPAAFGGADLVKQLTALGPAPKAVGAASASASASASTEKDKDSGIGKFWLLGVGLLIGIGGGLVLSLQRKRGAKL